MKKLVLIILLLLSGLSYGVWKDTGFIEFRQPNGISFIARTWGDEYFHWSETADGYRIVLKGNWYYYALLNEIGDFQASDRIVGVNTPPQLSYKLERISTRIQEINNEMNRVNQLRDLQSKALGEMSSLIDKKLGVVLVDFTPSERNVTAHHYVGYYKIDFENMLFSTNAW